MARLKGMRQDQFKFYISAVFMILVGLSMPALFNESASAAASAHRRHLVQGSDDDDDASGSASHEPKAAAMVPPATLILHVVVCTVLMNVGKMFPAFCFKSEVSLRMRIALAIGMMPRGEVCAGIIVNAIALGVTGVSISIAVLCLAVNMISVSGFIFLVKTLAMGGASASMGPTREQETTARGASSAGPMEA